VPSQKLGSFRQNSLRDEASGPETSLSPRHAPRKRGYFSYHASKSPVIPSSCHRALDRPTPLSYPDVVEKQTRLVALAALVLFIYLAAEVWRGQAIAFDVSIRNTVHAWASPPLTFLMRGVTWFGSSVCLVILAALAVCFLAARGRKRAAIILVVASAGAEALDQILKFAFQRARPQAFFDFVRPIGYSFPSGHSITACCFYGVLAAILAARQPSRALRAAIWTAAALLCLAIGFSRIYLGVHYPSDVLAGYAAALVWLAAVRAGYEFRMRRRPAVREGPNR